MTISVDETKRIDFTARSSGAYKSNSKNGINDPYLLPLAGAFSTGGRKNNPSVAAFFEAAYVGGFKMTNTLGGSYTTTNARIAYNASKNSIFTTDQALNQDSAVTSNESIAEVEMPTLGALTKDHNTFPEATNKLQDWVPYLNGNQIPTRTFDYNALGGLAYDQDTGALIVQAYIGYSGGGDSAGFFRIDDASNLAGSDVKGSWKTSTPKDFDTSWFQELPATWKQALGQTHMLGNGGGFSNKERASSGPSAFTTNLAELDLNDVTVPLQTTKIVNYPQIAGWAPLGTGTALYAGNKAGAANESYNNTQHFRNYDQYNNFGNYDANEGVPKWDINNVDIGEGSPGANHYNAALVEKGNNDIWTELSQAAGAFVVPGTRTLCAFGLMAGGEHGAGYKMVRYVDGVPGTPGGGGTTVVADDRVPYYWLYDMAALRDDDSGAVPPYAYGTLDIFDGIPGSPVSCMCDPRTGVAFISFSGGPFATEGGAVTSVLRFQFPADE